MLRLAICDCKLEYRLRLCALLESKLQTLPSEIESFPSSEDLLRYIGSGYTPDVAVLGIASEADRVISLAERLNALVPACRIIFVSDELRFATEVYRADHVWFLLRSELEERIGPALRKALSSMEAYQSRGILIRSRGKAVFVPLGDVLYLERDCRRTIVKTGKEVYTSSERPHKLLESSPADAFIHCHRSYWVNKAKIEALERDDFVLSNGELVPISRSLRAAAREAFFSKTK